MTLADHADAERHLAELLRQRARLSNVARFDSELRVELESVEVEIKTCKQALGRYCTECGNPLLIIDGTDRCCSGHHASITENHDESAA